MKSDEKSAALFDMMARMQAMISTSASDVKDVIRDVRTVANNVNKVDGKVDKIADQVGRLDAEMTDLKKKS